MAKYVSQFWFIAFLIIGAGLVYAQDDLETQFIANANKQIDTAVVAKISQALLAYQNKNYDEALKLLDEAITLSNNDSNLIELRQSLNRLKELRKLADGEQVKEKKVALDRGSEGERFLDKNRFLLQGLYSVDANLLNFNNENRSRMSMTGVLEGFLPQLDRSLGLYVGFTGQFFDIDKGHKARDYQLWEYKIAMQWRFAWNLPALEQRVSLALRIGLVGQEAKILRRSTAPDGTLTAFLLPMLELYLQDPLLSHIWSNVFTKNLIFAPVLSFGWLPAGKNPTALFKVGLDLNYRFAGFSFGPSYSFRYQYSFKSNRAIRSSVWALRLAYTWA